MRGKLIWMLLALAVLATTPAFATGPRDQVALGSGGRKVARPDRAKVRWTIPRTQRAARDNGSMANLLGRTPSLPLEQRGSSAAHKFIEKHRTKTPGTQKVSALVDAIRAADTGARLFTGPAADDSVVVMFSDKSGIYVHLDGAMTFMGADIRGEIGQYEEITRP